MARRPWAVEASSHSRPVPYNMGLEGIHLLNKGRGGVSWLGGRIQGSQKHFTKCSLTILSLN